MIFPASRRQPIPRPIPGLISDQILGLFWRMLTVRTTDTSQAANPFLAPQFGHARRGPQDVRNPAPVLPKLFSEDLFRGGHNELLIEHRGECYRLRLTRQDKLILNK